MNDKNNPNLILPAGTRVVARVPVAGTGGKVVHPKGAVGVIIKSPIDNAHKYRIRFLDDFEANMKREEFAQLRSFQDEAASGIGEALKDFELYDYVIYRCVIGSRAYGLDTNDSDVDRRGIYLPPAGMHWSLYGVPEQLENEENQECYWELQKFIRLALKSNPNILECLYTPLVETATPLARELLDMREKFLSRLVYQTYNGYVSSQFKKMTRHIENQGKVKWKHAMHLIRLLISGITVLKEAHVPVRVEEHRERLLAIRNAEVPFDEVNTWRIELHKEFDKAYENTKLPERPDYAAANEFLVKARGTMI